MAGVQFDYRRNEQHAVVGVEITLDEMREDERRAIESLIERYRRLGDAHLATIRSFSVDDRTITFDVGDRKLP